MENKISFLQIRVSEIEKAAIKAIADRQGISKSTLLRQVLQDKAHDIMTKKNKTYMQALGIIIKNKT